MNSLMLLAGTLFASYARRSRVSPFSAAIAAFAIAAPLLLVAYAFAGSLDAAARAHLVVGGLEQIVFALAAALAVRAAPGLRAAVRSLRQDRARTAMAGVAAPIDLEALYQRN
jgi:hypothetical protein